MTLSPTIKTSRDSYAFAAMRDQAVGTRSDTSAAAGSRTMARVVTRTFRGGNPYPSDRSAQGTGRMTDANPFAWNNRIHPSNTAMNTTKGAKSLYGAARR
jgi:hypothetical protein